MQSPTQELEEAILPPAIILVDPQLGENIGAAARAMLNCGLTDLRLVRPRDGWPSPSARANAAGADLVIDGVRVFDRTTDAIADLRCVYATTARSRDLVKPVLTPEFAGEQLYRAGLSAIPTGVLFGCERSGLSNDEVTLADAAITFSLNPGFRSLNLGQAVLLVSWEWRRNLEGKTRPDKVEPELSLPAARSDVVRLFEHFETELDTSGFFFRLRNGPIWSETLETFLAALL